MKSRRFVWIPATMAALLAVPMLSVLPASATAALPVITPTPHSMHRVGEDFRVPADVAVLADDSVERSTRQLVDSALHAAGARRVSDDPRGAGLTVVVGARTNPSTAAALAKAGEPATGPAPAEGYRLASTRKLAVLAGNDSAGTFYAAQTFRQLLASARVPAVSIVDAPAMPLRGSIEGFYGAPWSQTARLDQLRFYGRMKMNTYVYTPKDDPYLRDKWRDHYPAQDLARLKELVDTAKANHVRFTYAVSPGLSLCYSDPADVKALQDKLKSVYDIGVRSFSLPLDDISYTKWNCAGDEKKYGAASARAAGEAQADLLDTVQREFVAKTAGVQPLQTVPTEYSDVKETPYKKAIRERLDPAVVLMWTGVGVIAPKITVEDSQAADKVWGRKVFVWDNYPVNDYDDTKGRLLLAPYTGRAAGLSSTVQGDVLNPMNQPYASKVALVGGADYSWNDKGYDAGRSWRAAAKMFAGGDRRGTEALLAFFDTQYSSPLAPNEWSVQAPVLANKIAKFEDAYSGAGKGKKHAAVAELRRYQGVLAGASARIRAVTEQGFQADTKPWLDALSLWGNAFGHTLAALDAKADGDNDVAKREFDASAAQADKAAAIKTVPGTTRPQGPVKVADTVLDAFLDGAPTLR